MLLCFCVVLLGRSKHRNHIYMWTKTIAPRPFKAGMGKPSPCCCPACFPTSASLPYPVLVTWIGYIQLMKNWKIPLHPEIVSSSLTSTWTGHVQWKNGILLLLMTKQGSYVCRPGLATPAFEAAVRNVMFINYVFSLLVLAVVQSSI